MPTDFVDGIKWYLVFLLSACCHEAAHAWTARRLGDDTGHRSGQVTLDPTPHIRREPFGMVVAPLVSYLLGGWMIGWASTPYSAEWALRNPRRAASMALAGPAANFVLVLLAAWLMRIGFEWGVFVAPSRGGFLHVVVAAAGGAGIWPFVAKMTSLVFTLNLMLGTFNLVPLPPLDGSKIPLLFLSREAAEQYSSALRQPMFSWLGLFVAWKSVALVFPRLFETAQRLLHVAMPVR